MLNEWRNYEEISLFNTSILFLLVAIIALQSLSLSAAVSTAELKDYYARFTRGAKCYLQGKKCDPQDKKAVWQVGSGLLAALTLFIYTQRGRIVSLFPRRPVQPAKSEEHKQAEQHLKQAEERLKRIKVQQEEPKDVIGQDHQMITALGKGNLETVKKLAADPENIHIRWGSRSLPQIAISYALEYFKDQNRLEIVKVLLDKKAYDYQDAAKKYLIEFNKDVFQLTEQQKKNNRQVLERLAEINKLWNTAQK